MIKMFTKLFEKAFAYQRVQQYMEKTHDDPRVIRRIKRGIWLSIWMITSYRREQKLCEARYYNMKKNGMIMRLGKEYSGTRFCLPLLTLKNGNVCGDCIQEWIFKGRRYFDAISLNKLKEERYVAENMNVLDIGANIGNHTLFFANECKVNHIYSFEPVAKTYSMLRKNIELNGLGERVSLYNFALGRKSSAVSISRIEKNNCGATSLQYGGEDMKCYPLDDLSIDRKIDFIKIDVEGFENEVLLGGTELIKRDKPVIYVEIFEDNRDTVVNTLNSLGYVLKKGRYSDYLFLPTEHIKGVFE